MYEAENKYIECFVYALVIYGRLVAQ